MDDLISRQAVNDLIDELARAISDERCCVSRGRSTAAIMQDILGLPSVTPKEKTGKWVNEKWYGLDFIGVTCSNCGIIESRFSPYCPNCGVKMIKPQESEEEK